ncbi:MAG: type II secretion system protein GspM [Candidatus Omnitrophota bacterium]|nr:type II secretion system protein GspM [Candidatus Omnitrophota bacterium]
MPHLLNVSQRERNILIIIVILLFIFVCYYFLFQPLTEKLSALNKEIETKELKLKKSQKILSQELSVEGEFEKYDKYLKQNSSDEQEMAALLSEIEAVAHQINIKLNDMKPRKTKRIDFYNSFAVEIEAEGKLQEITKFIYTLQSPPHLLKAEKVRLEKTTSGSQTLKSYLLVTKILIPQ